jgi:uncharacterized protein
MTDLQLATPEFIAKVTQRIVEGYQPEGIYLFGSYANGQPTIDSDLDILVIKKTEETPIKRGIEVQRLLRGLIFPMDILVYTPDEVATRPTHANAFFE